MISNQSFFLSFSLCFKADWFNFSTSLFHSSKFKYHLHTLRACWLTIQEAFTIFLRLSWVGVLRFLHPKFLHHFQFSLNTLKIFNWDLYFDFLVKTSLIKKYWLNFSFPNFLSSIYWFFIWDFHKLDLESKIFQLNSPFQLLILKPITQRISFPID